MRPEYSRITILVLTKVEQLVERGFRGVWHVNQRAGPPSSRQVLVLKAGQISNTTPPSPHIFYFWQLILVTSSRAAQQSLLYSVTSSSNGGLFSPVGFPLGALAEQDDELKEQKEEDEQKEEQKEEKEEEAEGEERVRAFDQETRLGQNAACEEHRAAVRQQVTKRNICTGATVMLERL